MPGPFVLQGVVHLVRPSGFVAGDAAALRDGIASASDASLFYHVHHPRLRHPNAATPPQDDFSAWLSGVVQDREAAERLSYAVQAGAHDARSMRAALVAALPNAPEHLPGRATTTPESAFVFHEMDSVPVDLELVANDAEELVARLCGGHPTLFFHHVVESPWFGPAEATAAGWARANGEPRLAGWIEACAHDGRPLAESQRWLGIRWRRSRVVHRVTEATGMPEGVRQASARRVVRGLVRRITGSGPA